MLLERLEQLDISLTRVCVGWRPSPRKKIWRATSRHSFKSLFPNEGLSKHLLPKNFCADITVERQ